MLLSPNMTPHPREALFIVGVVYKLLLPGIYLERDQVRGLH